MDDNIQTNTTGRLTPCLQKKIDKTTYLVEVHFSDTSTQSVKDKLKRVILHDLEHGQHWLLLLPLLLCPEASLTGS